MTPDNLQYPNCSYYIIYFMLSAVPANVYGYAATAAYALQTTGAGSPTAMDMTNPVLLVAVSAVLGAVFGMISGKVAGMIGK